MMKRYPDRSVDDIPQELRSHVAFLHESITVHIPREGGGIRNHPLHGYLSSSSSAIRSRIYFT